jgi:hypothetical protein
MLANYTEAGQVTFDPHEQMTDGVYSFTSHLLYRQQLLHLSMMVA